MSEENDSKVDGYYPEGVRTEADLVARMCHLRILAGSPSFQELEQRAGKVEKGSLPHTTLNEVLKGEGRGLPRKDLVMAFVRACGANKSTMDRWVKLYDGLDLNLKSSWHPAQRGRAQDAREEGDNVSVSPNPEEWELEDEESHPGPDAYKSRHPKETQLVTVGRDEMLVVKIKIIDESENDNFLHRLYVEHSHYFDKEITDVIKREIGECITRFVAIEAGSIDVFIATTPPDRRRFGLDRIADVVREAVEKVIIYVLNRRGRTYNLVAEVSSRVVAARKTMHKKTFSDFCDAVYQVWGKVSEEVRNCFDDWLRKVCARKGWNSPE